MFNIRDHIRNIVDFPKPGITFRDITPLLQHPEALTKTTEALVALVAEQKIDKVAGIEARGFFFATLLAAELGAGFVPVRKKGKLPFRAHRVTYDLEYGTDSLEIHQDAITPGERILIHDDVLATGGTAAATANLIERAGGKIVQMNFLMELSGLGGREKLGSRPVKALLSL